MMPFLNKLNHEANIITQTALSPIPIVNMQLPMNYFHPAVLIIFRKFLYHHMSNIAAWFITHTGPA